MFLPLRQLSWTCCQSVRMIFVLLGPNFRLYGQGASWHGKWQLWDPCAFKSCSHHWDSCPEHVAKLSGLSMIPLRPQLYTSWTGGILAGKIPLRRDKCLAKVVPTGCQKNWFAFKSPANGPQTKVGLFSNPLFQPFRWGFWLWRHSPTSPNVYVCLSVRVWSTWKYAFILLQHPECMQNVRECSRMNAECSRIFQNACRMFQNACRMIKNACKMFQNIPECSRIFQNAWSMFQNIQEFMQYACRMFQNVPDCMQIHELACSYISLHAAT